MVAFSALIFAGLIWQWFFQNGKAEMPHFQWLLGITLADIAGIVIVIAKKGIGYLPETKTMKSEEETLAFLTQFISLGSSASIFSNRVSWLKHSDALMKEIAKKVSMGKRIEIITPDTVQDDIRIPLSDAGVIFIVTNEQIAPESRFTLINADRNGSEKLAIAKGVHPEHEITVFDSRSGPHIIGMAKSIIRKSKEMANAASLE
jgi:hypothetical protein